MPLTFNALETYRDDFTFRNSPAAIAGLPPAQLGVSGGATYNARMLTAPAVTKEVVDVAHAMADVADLYRVPLFGMGPYIPQHPPLPRWR